MFWLNSKSALSDSVISKFKTLNHATKKKGGLEWETGSTCSVNCFPWNKCYILQMYYPLTVASIFCWPDLLLNLFFWWEYSLPDPLIYFGVLSSSFNKQWISRSSMHELKLIYPDQRWMKTIQRVLFIYWFRVPSL